MSKSGAIIYYSWVGNTEVVAKAIQQGTGFDLFPIKEVKERPIGNIMWPAFNALLGLKSRIKPMELQMENYETLFIGTPVWAGKTPPALNKFLSRANLKGKKVRLFITKADEKIPQMVIDSITKRIEKKGGTVLDCLSVTTKWDPKTNIPMTAEELGSSVQDWI